MTAKRVRATLEERFSAKVALDPEKPGCILWTAAKTPQGYGLISAGGGGPLLYAHRVAWQLAHGPIPDGMDIRHRLCNNPSCVNVEHLEPGTRKENMADSVYADRTGRKLSNRDVTTIRGLQILGASGEDIAAEFPSLTLDYVRLILKGKERPEADEAELDKLDRELGRSGPPYGNTGPISEE